MSGLRIRNRRWSREHVAAGQTWACGRQRGPHRGETWHIHQVHHVDEVIELKRDVVIGQAHLVHEGVELKLTVERTTISTAELRKYWLRVVIA